jgi:hypothetical protein
MIPIALPGRSDAAGDGSQQQRGTQRGEMRVVGMIQACGFIGLVVHRGINEVYDVQVLRDV